MHDRWVRLMHELVRVENGIMRACRSPLRKAISELSTYVHNLPGDTEEWNYSIVKAFVRGHIQRAYTPVMATLRGLMRDFPGLWILRQARAIFRGVKPSTMVKLGPSIRAKADERRLKRIGVREAGPPIDDESDIDDVRQELEDRGMSKEEIAAIIALFLARRRIVKRAEEEMDWLYAQLEREAEAYAGTPEALIYAEAMRRAVDRREKTIESTITRGELTDRSAYEIKADLLHAISQAEFDLERVVRTAVQAIAGDTLEILMEYLGDSLVITVVWTTMLDIKVCLRCARLHGTVWYWNDPLKPNRPLHDLCRCDYILVYTVDTPDILESRRFSRLFKPGPLPEMPDYDSWLRTQPVWFQLKVLGPSRYAKFKAGMTISGFVNDANQIIRLDEIPWPRRRRRGLLKWAMRKAEQPA